MRLFRFSFIVSALLVFSGSVHGQWLRTTTPNGNASAICAVGGLLFAGFDIGNIYRSTDNGSTWTNASTGFPLNYPHNQGIGMTGTTLFACTGGYGIFRSSDSGANWKPTHNGLPPRNIYGVAFWGTNIYIATENGVYRSTNNGDVWESTAYTSQDFFISTIGPVVLAGKCRSVDSGKTWSRYENDMELHSFVVNGSKVYAAHYNSAYRTSAILHSSDSGLTWQQIAELQNIVIGPIANMGSHLWAGTNHGMLESDDAGEHWWSINEGFSDSSDVGYADSSVTALALNDQYVFIGSYFNGVWRRSLTAHAKVKIDAWRKDVSLYPNPASKTIVVAGATRARLLDVIGSERSVPFALDGRGVTLDLSLLPAGTYFVKTDRSSELLRLVKE